MTLVELLVGLAVAAVLLAASVPPLLAATRRARLASAAHQVLRTFYLARSHAIRHSANVGVRFRPHPEDAARVTWTLYRDGDGDGVASEDIDQGIDLPEGPPERRLAHFGRGVRFGFPPGRPPREVDGTGRIGRLDDPIRFNRSDIAAFTASGTATPGSVYLTDGRDGLACVRVTARTGRVRILLYDARNEVWR
jgi:type II secretory pathway pseudopilin PulG